MNKIQRGMGLLKTETWRNTGRTKAEGLSVKPIGCDLFAKHFHADHISDFQTFF